MIGQCSFRERDGSVNGEMCHHCSRSQSSASWVVRPSQVWKPASIKCVIHFNVKVNKQRRSWVFRSFQVTCQNQQFKSAVSCARSNDIGWGLAVGGRHVVGLRCVCQSLGLGKVTNFPCRTTNPCTEISCTEISMNSRGPAKASRSIVLVVVGPCRMWRRFQFGCPGQVGRFIRHVVFL